MTKAPKVSVVTITFNLIKAGRRDNIIQCVNSVHDQDYGNIEHVVIDGASSDGTLDLLRPYEEKGWLKIHSEPDFGIYDAMNKGIAKSTGEFIAFLNSDDFWHDKRGVSASIAALNKKNADFSFAQVYYLDEHDVREGVVDPVIGSFHTRMPCSHQSMFVSRKVFDTIGGFDTSLRSSADYDFVLRMCMAGFKYASVHLNFTSFRHTGLSSTTASNLGDIECAVSMQRVYSRIVPYTMEDARRHFDLFMIKKGVYDAIRKHVMPQFRDAMDAVPPEDAGNGFLRVTRYPFVNSDNLICILFDVTSIIKHGEDSDLARGLLSSLSKRKDIEVFLTADDALEKDLESLYAREYCDSPNTHIHINDAINCVIVSGRAEAAKFRRANAFVTSVEALASASNLAARDDGGRIDAQRLVDYIAVNIPPKPTRIKQSKSSSEAIRQAYNLFGMKNFAVSYKTKGAVINKLFDRVTISRIERTLSESTFYLFGIPLLFFKKRPERIDVSLFSVLPMLRLACYPLRSGKRDHDWKHKFKTRLLELHPGLFHPGAAEFARLANSDEIIPAMPICFFGKTYSVTRMYTTRVALRNRLSRFVLKDSAIKKIKAIAESSRPVFIDFEEEEVTTQCLELKRLPRDDSKGGEPLQRYETLEFANLPFLGNASGFSMPEQWGCWTSEHDVRFLFKIGKPDSPLAFRFTVAPHLGVPNPRMLVKCFLNGRKKAAWHFTLGKELPNTEFTIPAHELPESGRLAFRFEISEPLSPAELGTGTDCRKLGLAFYNLRILERATASAKRARGNRPPNNRDISLIGKQQYFKLSGFAQPEFNMRWAIGKQASISWQARNITAPLRTVIVPIMAYGATESSPRKIDFYAGGIRILSQRFTDEGWHTISLPISIDAIDEAKRLAVTFRAPTATSPKSHAGSPDTRILAFAIRSIKIVI